MFFPDLSGFFRTLFITIGILFVWGIFSTYKMFKNRNVLESKTRIIPDYRLETNGKKVDTIFIYRKTN